MRLPLASDGGSEPLYVYAAPSRRAGGVVLGIDLSQARCNWACTYCDVEGLSKGEGPEIDLERLRAEFDAALNRVTQLDGGPATLEELAGVHFSGNGEPTQSFQFPDAVEVVTDVLAARGLQGAVRPVLLTNGSKCSDRRVRIGLARLAEFGGHTWLKLDSATREGQRSICDSDLILRHVRNYLKVAAETMPTWLQTCVFERGGAPSLDEAEREAYVAFVRNLVISRVPLAGVQMVAPDRPVAGAGAGTITAPERGWVEALAEQLRAQLPVELYL
ncbi:radical SAM protein [Engelhardtia mirabilis]|uniref:Radical SAM superfamily protein n=1 Tax=Engelhardtia mirabilis TaxID=2528011 RepID=A0A518BG35_9BACT|nr:hypothetical protein Pla133_10060 [Planctomycetes bacterium Pla133]QDV00266.1 hypothetical protein Pla86_10050 [Planctomycetes bacterium Pla86]